MTLEASLLARVEQLEARAGLSSKWIGGKGGPPVAQREAVFYEDTALFRPRIWVRQGADRFYFDSQKRGTAPGSNIDHSDLIIGPTDDDHLEYILHDGTRELTGDWGTGAFTIINEQAADAVGVSLPDRVYLDFDGGGLQYYAKANTAGKFLEFGATSTVMKWVNSGGTHASRSAGLYLEADDNQYVIGAPTESDPVMVLDQDGIAWNPDSAGSQVMSLNDSLRVTDDNDTPTAALLRLDYTGSDTDRNLIQVDAVSGGPTVEPFRVNAYGISGPPVANPYGATAYEGTDPPGQDDLTANAASNYTGSEVARYEVWITALAAPTDVFWWRKNGGSFQGPTLIDGSAQAIEEGVTVTFGATTGHSLNPRDIWVITRIPVVKEISVDCDTNTGVMMFRNTAGSPHGVLFDTVNATIDAPYLFFSNGAWRASIGGSFATVGPVTLSQSNDPTINFDSLTDVGILFYDTSEDEFNINKDLKLSNSSPTFSFGAGGTTELLTLLGTGSLNNNYLFGGSGDTVALNVGIISTAMISSQAFNFSTSAGTAQFTGAAGVNFIAPAGDINFTATSGVAKLNSPAQVEQYADIQDIAEPTSPTSDYTRVFHDVGDGELKVKKSSGDVVSLEGSEMPFAVRYDDVGGGIAYSGEAVAGSATSAAAWRVKRLTSSGPDITVEWADGDTSQDNIWDNRASLSYS